MTSDEQEPNGAIRVAIVNDYEVVVRGVAALLAPFTHRVRVVDAGAPADVVLLDTFAGRRRTLELAAELVGQTSRVALYTGDAGADVVRAARDIGVAGIVLKSRSADALVTAIERIGRGERVGIEGPAPQPVARPVELSERESEVLALIAKGLTNAEIADELYLSIETIKTYVKRLYAKLDVHNRAQAAAAASAHHLDPRNGLSGA